MSDAAPGTASPTDTSVPDDSPAPVNVDGTLRVDIWLWTTRQVRTRSAATSAAKAGHVKVNGGPAKASTKVRAGDEVRLRVQGFDRILIVKGLPKKRLGAPLARPNYEDISPERPKVYLPPLFVRPPGAGRPTKKERRELDRLRGIDPNAGRRER